MQHQWSCFFLRGHTFRELSFTSKIFTFFIFGSGSGGGDGDGDGDGDGGGSVSLLRDVTAASRHWVL